MEHAHVKVQFHNADEVTTIKLTGNGDNARGDYIDPNTLKDLHRGDGNVQFGVYNHDVPGEFATVTITNLGNDSYYTDPKTGQKIHIAKMVVHFTNLKRQKDFHALFGYDQFANVEEFNIQSSTITSPEFYDDNGNLIQYEPGTAWLMVSSLSNSAAGDWYEAAEVNNGNQIYQVSNKTVKGHPAATYHSDGRVYVDNWDGADAEATKYDNGQAVVRLVPGGTITMASNITHNPNDNYYNQISPIDINAGTADMSNYNHFNWYQWTISSAMLPTNNPAPKTTLHYHYDE